MKWDLLKDMSHKEIDRETIKQEIKQVEKDKNLKYGIGEHGND